MGYPQVGHLTCVSLGWRNAAVSYLLHFPVELEEVGNLLLDRLDV